MIRVLLADDHALVRAGVKQLLSFTYDIVVTGEAATGEEVLQRLEADSFDIILLDLNMPGISGKQLIARVRAETSNPPILVLTMHTEPMIARRKLDAGAMGYLTKDCSPCILEKAIRKVADGGRYISPWLAEKLIFETGRTLHKRLSKQELRILKLFAQGLRVVDIATQLNINKRTVSTHKSRLMLKLEIEHDADLIRYADTNGLK